MSETIALIAAFVVLSLIEFAAFGMQRATLLMSRETGVSSQISALLLPSWFPAMWLVIIAKWGTLLLIGFSWNWWVAVSLAVADFVLSSVLPIPYSVYVPSFRKRVAQYKSSNTEVGAVLEAMLDASKLSDT